MSIKILLVSSDEELFNKIELVYKKNIESGFLKIYSPKSIETNPVKVHYDLILADEKYLSLIPVKKIPIIVMTDSDVNEPHKGKNNNYIYFTKPIDWQNLYDTIIGLQYRYKNSDISLCTPPKIEHITKPLPITVNKKTELATINNNTELEIKHKNMMQDNLFLGEAKEYNKEDVEYLNKDSKQNNNDKTENNKQTKTANPHQQIDHRNENHQLTTKLYHFEDITRMNKVLANYGTNNAINDKIIAQASIILDELIYTMTNLNNNIVEDKEPKLLMTILHNEDEFKMNIECLTAINNNIDKILSMAQDYAHTMESFKRNNSVFLNLQWHI